MWILMLSTETSMRFFIRGSILPFGPPHPCYFNAPDPLRVTLGTYVRFERGEGTTWACDPDRPPRLIFPAFFPPPPNSNPGRPGADGLLGLTVEPALRLRFSPVL